MEKSLYLQRSTLALCRALVSVPFYTCWMDQTSIPLILRTVWISMRTTSTYWYRLPTPILFLQRSIILTHGLQIITWWWMLPNVARWLFGVRAWLWMTQPSHLPSPVCRECESSKSWVSHLLIPWILHLTSHLLYPRPPVLSMPWAFWELTVCLVASCTMLLEPLSYQNCSMPHQHGGVSLMLKPGSDFNRSWIDVADLASYPPIPPLLKTLVLDQCSTLFNDIKNNNFHVYINCCLPLETHHMISARALANEASQCRTIAWEKHFFVTSYSWTPNTFNL